MMRFAISAATLVLAAAACAAAAKSGVAALDSLPPDVSGGPSVSWYDVHGRTAAEVDLDLRREGPKAGGRPIIDEYWYPIQLQDVVYRPRSNGVSCWVEDARVHVSAHILMPRFTPPPDADPDLASEWNAFQQFLIQHEVGHKNIAGQAAQDLVTRLNSLSSSCMTFSRDVYALIAAVSAAEQKSQRQYDVETYEALQQASVQHGASSIAVAPAGGRAREIAPSDTARARAAAQRESVSPLAEPSLSDVAKKAARVSARPDTLTLGVGALVQLDAFTVTVYDSTGAELRHLINGAYDIRLPPCPHLAGNGRSYRATSEGTCELVLAFPAQYWTRPDSAPTARVLLRFTR